MSALNKLRNRLLVFVLFIVTLIRLTIGRARPSPSVEPRTASQGFVVELPVELGSTRHVMLRRKSALFVPTVARTVRVSRDITGDKGREPFDLSAASLVSSNSPPSTVQF